MYGFIFLSAVILTYLARWAALRFQWMDIPNARSLHKTPTPRVGGIGIVIPVTCGLGLMAWQWHSRDIAIMASCGLLLSLMGLWDDLRSLPARLRLLGQVAIAGTIAGYLLIPSGLGPWWILWPLGTFWLTGLINAFNFMDGSDGMVGVQTCVVSVGWVVLGIHISSLPCVIIAGLLFSATLGFLVWNWAPARVFLGDNGSTYLGLFIGTLPLLATTQSPKPATTFAAGALLIWPFLADTSLTLVRRYLKGENILEAHRSHFYQHLILRGHSHKRVALLYGAFSALGLLIAYYCL